MNWHCVFSFSLESSLDLIAIAMKIIVADVLVVAELHKSFWQGQVKPTAPQNETFPYLSECINSAKSSHGDIAMNLCWLVLNCSTTNRR